MVSLHKVQKLRFTPVWTVWKPRCEIKRLRQTFAFCRARIIPPTYFFSHLGRRHRSSQWRIEVIGVHAHSNGIRPFSGWRDEIDVVPGGLEHFDGANELFAPVTPFR